MNTAACATNLIKAATNVGLIFASAFFPSKPAPKVINASGVAIDAGVVNSVEEFLQLVHPDDVRKISKEDAD